MTTQTVFTKKDCHDGNSIVYQYPDGGTLYIGGWNMGARFNWNTHVIDLTGSEHKYWDVPFAYDEKSKDFMPFLYAGYKGWLSLPFPDYKVPQNLNTYEQWEGIATVIKNLLREGTDVLVACHGGHGRSGLFCSIVGYILAIDTDKSWSSPVEKVRNIHCEDAVETIEQEKFVYNILGLDIQIKRAYNTKTWTPSTTFPPSNVRRYIACPICGNESMFVDEFGMCLGCQSKYTPEVETRLDLTLEDIKNKGLIAHSCKREKCVGIWKAEKCGHVVHDQIIYEGLCTTCWDKKEANEMYAEQKLKEMYGEEEVNFDDYVDQKTLDALNVPCAVCGEFTLHAKRFGVCYDCAEEAQKSGKVSWVHNSITDPYVAYPHYCKDVACVGIITADVCGHTVHNMEVEDGICPECLTIQNMKKNGGVQ